MHGARLVGYPVYYMSRAPAAPDIGTQHLKIPNVDSSGRTGRDSWSKESREHRDRAYVRTHVVPSTHSLDAPGICTRVEGSLSATR